MAVTRRASSDTAPASSGSWSRAKTAHRKNSELDSGTTESRPCGSVAAAESRFLEAIEHLSEGLALFDADDRFVAANSAWRRFSHAALDLLVPGTRFEDIVRRMAASGEIADAAGREEEWVQARLEHHESPADPLLIQQKNGRWIRIEEHRGSDGSTTHILADVTDLKRRELALGTVTARFEAVLDNAPALIYLKDRSGRYTMINRAFEKTYKRAASSIVGKTLNEIFPDSAVSFFAETDRLVLESGCPVEREVEDPTDPGGRILHVVKFPIRDSGGEIVAIGGIETDITERVRIETAAEDTATALRERSRQLDIALGNITQGLTLYDAENRLTFCNQRYLDMYGLPAEAVRPGTALREIFALSIARGNYTYETANAALEERLRVASSRSRETSHQHLSDGRTIEVIHQPLPDGGAVATFTDITERKRAEEALRTSEERFRDVAEVTSDWIWEMDENLRFSYFSERLGEIMSLDTSQLIGKTREEVGEARDDVWAQHYADLEARRPFRNFLYRFRHPDGRKAYFSISGKPVHDHDGQFLGYRGTGTDVTAQVIAEKAQIEAKEQAEIANRAKSEFLANMSHELRTPLNAILGFSQIMRDELLGPLGQPKYRDYINHVHDSGSHLLSLINDILDLSKVEAGRVELEEEEINVPEAVEAAVRIIRPRAEAAYITVRTSFAPAMPMLRADPRSLKQMLLNLLSNAVKFTGGGRRIDVSACLDNDLRVIIEVTDTGIGVAEEDLQKVMTAFGQVDNAYTRKHQGTGLGLPLVKTHAELHGGILELQSIVGRGTTARLIMPSDRTLAP